MYFLFLFTLQYFVIAQDPEACSFCEWIVAGAENLVSQNESQAEILAFLENACGIFPDPQKTQVCSLQFYNLQ